MSRSQVNIFIIFVTLHLGNWNASVARMMKMWGIATSNQGGRGLASFVGTIYYTQLLERLRGPGKQNHSKSAVTNQYLKITIQKSAEKFLKVVYGK